MRICALSCVLLLVTGYSAAQDTSFAVGPQYLLAGSPLLARPLATPSMSLDAPLPPVPPSITPAPEPVTGVASATTSEVQRQADLIPIYYGVHNHYEAPTEAPTTSVVELSSPEGAEESLAALPASIFDSGVSGLTDTQTLQMRGYGVTLADAASYWKTHRVPARHVFTNEDVRRLHAAG
jgi:hypothetical protein